MEQTAEISVAMPGLILIGDEGVGKSTVCGILSRRYGWTAVDFDDKAKDAVSAIFGYDREMLAGRSTQAKKWLNGIDLDGIDFPIYYCLGKNFTPRQFLDDVIESLREDINPDIWALAAITTAAKSTSPSVLGDCRRINELKLAKKMGYRSVRILRPASYDDASGIAEIKVNSEIPDDYEADYTLENDGTLEDLARKLSGVVNTWWCGGAGTSPRWSQFFPAPPSDEEPEGDDDSTAKYGWQGELDQVAREETLRLNSSDYGTDIKGPGLILLGEEGSGKSTVCEMLRCDHGWVAFNFAKRLKDAVAAIFGYDRAMLEGYSKKSRKWRETPEPVWSRYLGEPITPREIIIAVAESLRSKISAEIWAAVAITDAKQCEYPTVIGDCRRNNEMTMAKKFGYKSVRIRRPGHNSDKKVWDKIPTDAETDYVIDNDGTFEDLRLATKKVVSAWWDKIFTESKEFYDAFES